MTIKAQPLLIEIETFLSETKMSSSYFGKKATGNSEVVKRLQKGGRVWPETEMKIRLFMAVEEQRKHRQVAA